MQSVADIVVALMVALEAFIRSWWASLVLLAVAWALRRRTMPALRKFSSRRAMYVSIAALSLVASVARTTIVGEPRPPWYTDDFGYALAADTFAQGRITNPSHPMRAYLTTLYVLDTPTYSSLYPPGPGLLVAFGQVVLRSRVAALWVATAAAACLVAWCIVAVAPLSIAWLAGLLFAIHPTVLEWLGHYHSAALSVCAGALVIGGALRLRDARASIGAAIALGAGTAILANTRPYEGFVVAAIGFAIAHRAWRRLPIAFAVALLGLALTGAFNRAVTGSAWTMPYNAYNARYLSAPNFIWQRPLEVRAYPTEEMDRRYRIFRRYYERSRDWGDFFGSAVQRVADMAATAMPTVRPWSPFNSLRLMAAVPLLFAFRRGRSLLASLLFFTIAILLITWWPQTHYFAPAVALFATAYAIGVATMMERGHSLLACFAVAASFVVAIAAGVTMLVAGPRPKPERVQVTETLNRAAGGHLVLVHEACEDVVWNAADIDGSKIVWANDAADARSLLAYYGDRSVWRLTCGAPMGLTQVRRPVAAAKSAYVPNPY